MCAGAAPVRQKAAGGGACTQQPSIHLKMSELHKAAQAGTDIKHSRGESFLSEFFPNFKGCGAFDS